MLPLTLPYFFFDLPIYTRVNITENDLEILWKIFDKSHSEPFDGYNPVRKIESTFVVITDLCPTGPSDPFYVRGGYGEVKLKCKRSGDIFRYYLLWKSEENSLIKIGQYPSVADFHISEVKQYSKLLKNDQLKEFTKAIGLAANGVGIGSFVYLRRIFESLIQQAFNSAKNDTSIDEEAFAKSRMDEKIALLAKYLPPFLVENKSMYGILSLGVHQLDEQDCLANFDALRVGIEIILDEKLEEIRKHEKIEGAKKKIAAINSSLKNRIR